MKKRLCILVIVMGIICTACGNRKGAAGVGNEVNAANSTREASNKNADVIVETSDKNDGSIKGTDDNNNEGATEGTADNKDDGITDNMKNTAMSWTRMTVTAGIYYGFMIKQAESI